MPAAPAPLPSAISHSLGGGLSSHGASGLSAAEFGASEFDLRSFINAQLEAAAERDAHAAPTAADSATPPTAAPSLSSATGHLSSLLMKLNLIAADINSTMEIQSQELVSAMPKAMREIAFIHRESQSLRANLSDILRDMATIEHTKPSPTAVVVSPVAAGAQLPSTPAAAAITGEPAGSAASAASTIDFLQSIDTVKTRIERCAGTLEELDRWAKRERLVEQLFERLSGASSEAATVLPTLGEAAYQDLARIHAELANMRAIIDRFRTLGVAAVESDARAANLVAYEKKLLVVARLLLEQALEALAANTVPTVSDEDGTPAVSATVVSQLRILRAVFGEESTAAFEAAYQSGKVKAALSKRIFDKYASKPTVGASGSASEYDPKRLDEWLEAFLVEVVRFARDEVHFARHAFCHADATADTQPDAPKLVSGDSVEASTLGDGSASCSSHGSWIYSSVLGVLHDELSPLLSMWLSAYLAAHKGSDSLALLLRVWERCCKHLGWGLAQLMLLPNEEDAAAAPGTDSDAALASRERVLVSLLLHPFERYLVEYGSFERKALFASLEVMSFGGESYDLLSANIAAMHRVIARATDHALARCAQGTHGTLVEPLVEAMAEYYTEVAQRLFSLLRRLRRIAGLDGATPAAPPASKAKSPAGSPNPDGQDAGAAGDAGNSAESQFASFQGAFGLLRVCRALQWDLFSPHAEHVLLTHLCTTDMVAVMRAAEDEAGLVGLRPSTAAATTPGRRQSSAAAAPAAHSHVKTHADLTKLLASSFLSHHPDRLKSLGAFLVAHCAHLYVASSAPDSAHATQGLHTHGHPSTPITVASVSVVSPGGGGGGASGSRNGKYGGFPSSGAASPTLLGAAGSSTMPSHLFASPAALFESFISAVHNLILDTMFKPIGSRLASFHEWSSIWCAKAPTNLLSSIPLPAFSLQPSDYMIFVGEHLLTLVTQMEPFVSKQEDEEGEQALVAAAGALQTQSLPGAPSSAPPPAYLEHDALYWLNLLSRGTFKHLVSSIHQLSLLSERGAKQLACDLEYLVNVLAALGLTIPPLVLKLQTWLAWTEPQAAAQLAEGRAGEECRIDDLHAEEMHMLRQILKIRRFATIAADKQIQARLNP